MNTPMGYGADGIATLFPISTASGSTPNVGLQLSNAPGQLIFSYSNNPILTAPGIAASSTVNSISINPTNGRIYRKIDVSGTTTSVNFEQIAPFVCCIATSAAGNLFPLANTIYYLDFPTTVYDPMGGIAGAGSGNTTTSGGTWRYVYPMRGYYLISTIIEFANVASNNTLSFVASGSNLTYGSEAMSPTGNTINRTSISSSIFNFTTAPTATNPFIQVQGRAGVINTAQSTTAVNNKVIITYLGRGV